MTRHRIKIAHVSSAHPWTDNRIHYREANSLARLGYEVTLFAASSAVDGPRTDVRVCQHPQRSRAKRVTVSNLQVVLRAFRSGAELVHLHDPELAWSIPIFRLLGRRVVFDAHEDLPTQVRGKAYLGPVGRSLSVCLAHLVVWFVRCSHHVVAATETIAERFPDRKVSVVHNYPPLPPHQDDAPDIAMRDLSVVYVGGISSKRGSGPMVEALAKAPAGWNLKLAGAVADEEYGRLTRLPGWDRVDFRGQIPPDQVRELLLEARVGMVLFSDSAAHRDALPTKMFEYFAAGLPVVASDFPLWRSIVVENGAGIVVDQDDPEQIAAALSRYAVDPSLLERHSAAALDLARRRLNWEVEVPRLAGAYEDALRGL